MSHDSSMHASLLNKPSSQEGLKPCPFCGKAPETQRSGDGQKGFMINCIAPGCVNPHVSYYDHATAIRVWNTRHPSFNDAIEAAAQVCDQWIGTFQDKDVKSIPARVYAVDAMEDVAENIRSLKLPDYRGGEKKDSTKTAEG